MVVQRAETYSLQTSDDVVRVRQIVRGWSVELGFSLIDQTKVVTAASELARNTVTYGAGGTARLEAVQEGGRPLGDPVVAPKANEPVATPDPPGQPPSPEAAPVAEAGEPVTNEDVKTTAAPEESQQ